jgi:hypothetical protein
MVKDELNRVASMNCERSFSQRSVRIFACNFYRLDGGVRNVETMCIYFVRRDPMAGTYDNFYWRSLPEHAKQAAEVLGYTKALWDKDMETDITNNNDWDDLTDVQKEAAEILGWTQLKWDKDLYK